MLRSTLCASVALISGLSISACAKGPTPQERFEPLYRAAKSVEGAVSVGVNKPSFGEHLQRFATEILAAKDRATTPEETAMVDAYSEVLGVYKDSAVVWKLPGERAVVEGELVPIVARYKVPTEDITLTSGESFKKLADESVRVVWAAAEAPLRKAHGLYLGLGKKK